MSTFNFQSLNNQSAGYVLHSCVQPEHDKAMMGDTGQGVPGKIESNASMPKPIGGVPIPDYLLNARNDIASTLFPDVGGSGVFVPEYKGAGDFYDNFHRLRAKIIQRGVTGLPAEQPVMGWMNLGIQMAEKAIAMVNADDPRAAGVLIKYFSDASPETRRIFVDYATKAIATLRDQVRLRGAQVVVTTGPRSGAEVYEDDPHKRIFIDKRVFNALANDPWAATLMLHETTHFFGADDYGYISDQGYLFGVDESIPNKLNNSDSLAYAMRELYERGVPSFKPEPPAVRPEKPLHPGVDISSKPVLPTQQHVDYQLWNDPLGGQQRVEVWNEGKEKQGGYKDGAFVVQEGTAYRRWRAPSGHLVWIEAYDPQKNYQRGQLAWRRGEVVQLGIPRNPPTWGAPETLSPSKEQQAG